MFRFSCLINIALVDLFIFVKFFFYSFFFFLFILFLLSLRFYFSVLFLVNTHTVWIINLCSINSQRFTFNLNGIYNQPACLSASIRNKFFQSHDSNEKIFLLCSFFPFFILMFSCLWIFFFHTHCYIQHKQTARWNCYRTGKTNKIE